MGVCFLGNQCRLKSSSSILRNTQVVLQGTEQVARSQSEKPLTSSEGSVTGPCQALSFACHPPRNAARVFGKPRDARNNAAEAGAGMDADESAPDPRAAEGL